MQIIKYMFTLLLLMSIMFACVDSGDNKIKDTISGIYYLEGPRLTVEDPCFHCAAGEDTLRERVSFSVIAQLDNDNPDRIQFYGIQGADTGDFGKRVFPDCTRSADCEVFGKVIPSGEFVINGGSFEIDIENNGHRYQATGFFSSSTSNLQGKYTYEGITIDYELTGKRVSLTLED